MGRIALNRSLTHNLCSLWQKIGRRALNRSLTHKVCSLSDSQLVFVMTENGQTKTQHKSYSQLVFIVTENGQTCTQQKSDSQGVSTLTHNWCSLWQKIGRLAFNRSWLTSCVRCDRKWADVLSTEVWLTRWVHSNSQVVFVVTENGQTKIQQKSDSQGEFTLTHNLFVHFDIK